MRSYSAAGRQSCFHGLIGSDAYPCLWDVLVVLVVRLSSDPVIRLMRGIGHIAIQSHVHVIVLSSGHIVAWSSGHIVI